MPDNSLKLHGHRLRDLRSRAGWSQKQLADMAKLYQYQISNYEREEKGCYYNDAQRLVEVLKPYVPDGYDAWNFLVRVGESQFQYYGGPKEPPSSSVLISRTLLKQPEGEKDLKELIISIEEILADIKHYVIIGERGLGKTALLHQIAVEAGKNGHLILRADSEKGELKSTKEYETKIIESDRLDRSIWANKTLFFVDHVNSMNRDICDQINTLVNGLSDEKVQFIIACDCFYYPNELISSLYPIWLGTLTIKERESLLKLWGITRLHSDEEIHENLLNFCGNPRTLNAVAEIINNTDGQLCEAAIYEHYYTQYSRLNSELLELKLKCLSSIAFQIWSTDAEDGIEWSSVYELLNEITEKEEIKKKDDVILQIKGDILSEGLIFIDDDHAQVIFNSTVLNFFVAWYMAKELDPRASIGIIISHVVREEAYDEIGSVSQKRWYNWTQIIILYAGLIEDATPLTTSIKKNRSAVVPDVGLWRKLNHDAYLSDKVIQLDELTSYINYCNLRLAGLCINSAKKIDENEYRDTIDTITDKYLTDYRYSGLGEVLINSQNEEIDRKLMHYLGNETSSVVVKAIELLGKRHCTAAIEKLISLTTHGDEYIRSELVSAFRNIRSKSTVQPLINMLEEADDFLQQRIIYAIRKIAQDEGLTCLIQNFKDGTKDIKPTIVMALQYYDDPHSIEFLKQIVRDKKEDKRLRLLAEKSLDRLDIHIPNIEDFLKSE